MMCARISLYGVCVVWLVGRTTGDCVLPQHPAHGRHQPQGDDCGGSVRPPACDEIPGTPAPEDWLLTVVCNPGYQPPDPDVADVPSVCTNGSWSIPQLTDCVIPGAIVSDDKPEQTVPTVPSSSTSTAPDTSPHGCVLPKASPTRKFCSLTAGCEECDVYNRPCLVPQNATVDKVKTVCAPGYSIRTSDISVCLADGWYPSIPECVKLCRPLVSGELLLKCWVGTDLVDCSKLAKPGTTVSYQCLPGFSEYPNLKRQGAYTNDITCSSTGEWSESLPPCKPECGVSKGVNKFSSTIFNGTEAHIGFFPWHAGIYFSMEIDGKTQWEQRCGGSLITDQMILTAAHCVSDVANVSNIRIALGKYFRSWDTFEPTEEKREVLAISVPPNHRKATFIFDIALVLMSKKIKFSEYIMPVCRDYEESTAELLNANLYIVGWGKTDVVVDGPPSENLHYSAVRSMPIDQCLGSIPVYYPTYEKLCAVKNNSEPVTQSGDGGGGLTAVYKDGLHYIVGITSISFLRMSLFTNVKFGTNKNWIDSEIRELTEYIS